MKDSSKILVSRCSRIGWIVGTEVGKATLAGGFVIDLITGDRFDQAGSVLAFGATTSLVTGVAAAAVEWAIAPLLETE